MRIFQVGDGRVSRTRCVFLFSFFLNRKSEYPDRNQKRHGYGFTSKRRVGVRVELG